MRDETKAKKQEQIEQAAYALLEQYGYEGISMLKIAKQAKASNETLYRWYGDKKGLFYALVESNARHVKAFLQNKVGDQGPALETLDELGPILLDLLLGDRAVALNKAAAGDPSGELGKALAKSGRDEIVPLIAKTFDRLCVEEISPPAEPAKMTELYLRLLLGDLQVRRVTGAISKPSKTEIEKRSREAQSMIYKIIESGA
jgi:AcrR family transcriptional regulator